MTISDRMTQPKTETPVKKAALVMRVSTDRQARNEEGSLKNQVQRLRQHIEYKTSTCGETWVEAGVYELKGISGKNSMRSPELERLFADIRAGRVNTVLCTALDRICRSVKDFLWFFEFLNEQHTEFVCLKQNYDTTSPQGRLFVTMMIALAQFEREQTGERTKDAMAARSERGLWNGGRLLGYDADPVNKSKLIPNVQETIIVNFAFDKYIECGSLVDAAEEINRQGYRTKAYTSRRDVVHPGSVFQPAMLNHLLKNVAYIGKKKVRGPGPASRLVDAAWPPIVSIEKFEAAQRLLQQNGRTRHNAAAQVEHAYVLSRGVLHCGRCGTAMTGRCGTGRLGKKYFYYACSNKDCTVRIAADEVEGAVLERIKELAGGDTLVERLTAETNARLLKQKPDLERQKEALIKSLSEVKGQADRVLGLLTSGVAGTDFVKDKLGELSRRRADIERGVSEVDEALARIHDQSLRADEVREALGRVSGLYAQLTPFEKRELMGLVLKSATVREREITLEIYALSIGKTSTLKNDKGEKVRLWMDWLPDEGSNLEPSG